jgi:hypothetical protein
VQFDHVDRLTAAQKLRRIRVRWVPEWTEILSKQQRLSFVANFSMFDAVLRNPQDPTFPFILKVLSGLKFCLQNKILTQNSAKNNFLKTEDKKKLLKKGVGSGVGTGSISQRCGSWSPLKGHGSQCWFDVGFKSSRALCEP